MAAVPRTAAPKTGSSTGSSKDASPSRKPISLALQGGGAWGAYTWGVLNQLLGRRDLQIDAISGTSAGALNGAIVCSQLATGSTRQAREALESFWHSMSSSPAEAMFTAMMGPMSQMITRLWSGISRNGSSPFRADPIDMAPMRKAIEAHVNIDAIRAGAGPELFVTATNVQTGLPRVFSGAEMSIDALLASACLPQIFRPIEIDGAFYWDGGYTGNPTLWPLIRHGGASDLLLVQLTPERRSEVPRDAASIRERLIEVVFSSSLVAEMQAIHALQIADRSVGARTPFSDLRLHRIGPPGEETVGDTSSALDRSLPSLLALRDEGLGAAQRFLRRHGGSIGVSSTLDIARTYADPRKPRLRLNRPPRHQDLPDEVDAASAAGSR